MAAVVLLVGLPGAGKSTLSRQLVAALGSTYEVHYICFDEAFLEQRATGEVDVGEFQPQQWKDAVAAIYCRVDAALAGAAARGVGQKEKLQAFLLDDNMYYRSMRKKYWQLCRQRFGQIYVNTARGICRARNSQRPNPVPEAVIMRMEALLQPPHPSLHSWEARFIEVDLSLHSSASLRNAPALAAATALIRDALAHPVVATTAESCIKEKQEESRASNAASVVHRADLALRQLVGHLLRDTRKSGRVSIAELARRLSATKDAALQRYREEPVQATGEDAVDAIVADFLTVAFVDSVLCDVPLSVSTMELQHLVDLATGHVLRFRLQIANGSSVEVTVGQSATMATLLQSIRRELTAAPKSLSWKSVFIGYQLHCNGHPFVFDKKPCALATSDLVRVGSVNELVFVRHTKRRRSKRKRD
ncbi:hypothetical protein ACHHYP_08354 [Achlya hypogyna]|uniref:Uncharacterized protein n=1 Tax=Achlya hypogyna TaxID=1202772 RepID=A0A1V9ZKX5_ACHHY|nr:hypothetical protein ACHHYP_08354 [Achlya hypogyna]